MAEDYTLADMQEIVQVVDSSKVTVNKIKRNDKGEGSSLLPSALSLNGSLKRPLWMPWGLRSGPLACARLPERLALMP